MEPTASTRTIPPLVQRLSLIMVGLVALTYALYYTQTLVLPLIFSLLLAILLDPLVKMQSRWGINRVVGISLAVAVAMVALAALGYFIATQAAHFSEAVPQLESKFKSMTEQLQNWLHDQVNVKPAQINNAVDQAKDKGLAVGGMIIGQTLLTVTALFGFFFLLPVFTFLFLYYKDLFHTFLIRLLPRSGKDTLDDVLGETKQVVQSFLIGRVFETVILAVMNYVGLLLIGVQYALLLAVLGAVLNLIPYVGMIVATVITVLIAMALQDLNAALWVLALYSLVQFIDNHFLVPLVVGAKVQLNAFFSIVVVIAGGMLWGVPGMFLSIPLAAMLKVIFDRVPGLAPWGYVLGMGEAENEKEEAKQKAKDEKRAARV